MKLLFLGTGAADWKIETRREGEFWRRFSSSLIDGTLLLDPGPHIFDFAEKNGTPALYDGVKDILCTHSHPDHVNVNTIRTLCAGKPVTLWGDDAIRRRVVREMGEEASLVTFRHLHHGEWADVGDYRVLPLHSNHSTGDAFETTLNYVIEKDDKRLFYGLDGAWLLRESWNVMRALPGSFDAMIFDLTCGEDNDEFRFAEHNTLSMLRLMLAGMKNKRNHVIGPDTKLYGDHMAKMLHTDHETLCRTVEPDGITIAYDGMEIEI